MAAYPISRFLNVRNAYFPSFSPVSGDIAFLTDITGVAQVWQVGLPPTRGEILWPDQLTFEADRVMGVWYSPVQGDTRLVYARDRGGNENAQLFLLDTATGVDTALTAGNDAAMHTFGQWSRSGDRIVFAANRRDPGLFDLYVQPIEGEARLAWRNDEPGFLFSISLSDDGGRALVARTRSSFDHDLLEVDLESGELRLLSPAGVQARFEEAHYASDGESAFILTDLDSDLLYIARLDLQTRAVQPLVRAEWDIDLMELSPDGRFLAYTTNADGASALYMFDVQSGESRPAPLPTSTPGVVGMLDFALVFSPDSRMLAFSFTSAVRASDVYAWDLETGEIKAITRSSHGGLPTTLFASPQLVHYPTFDRDAQGSTRLIPAWFYRPSNQTPGAAPLPVIVIVHGGPESQLRPNFNFLAQYFLNSGYAVLAPNVRGSTGYGKEYSHLDDVRKRMDSVADLAHAAYWLKQQPGIDGESLVVYGGSYGGFMVLSSLTTYPDLWAAGVDIVGISNFVTFLGNTSAYRRAHREAEYGSLEHDREFLQAISPLNQSNKIDAPLMVIHGANDPRVPLSEAEQLVQALKARGVPVEFLVFTDEGHGLVKLKNKLEAYPAVVRFLSGVLER